MPFFVPALIAGVSALAGALGNKEKTNTQTGSSSTNQSQTSTSANNFNTTPTYDPLQLMMRNNLLQQFFQRSNPEGIHDLVGSTVNQGVNDINRSGASNELAMRNMLASRGLSYSGAASTPLAIGNSARLGQITNLRNSAPILEDQIQSGRLTDFANFLKGLPTGQQGVSNSAGFTEGASHTDQAGSVTQPGNMMGGAVTLGAETLANLYGKGAFGKKGIGN